MIHTCLICTNIGLLISSHSIKACMINRSEYTKKKPIFSYKPTLEATPPGFACFQSSSPGTRSSPDKTYNRIKLCKLKINNSICFNQAEERCGIRHILSFIGSCIKLRHGIDQDGVVRLNFRAFQEILLYIVQKKFQC